MPKNNNESILRYSFSTFMVKIFLILLRLQAINISPASALALFILFLGRI
jgi:hypothetical protein